jgi:deoxycytidylate deaminase
MARALTEVAAMERESPEANRAAASVLVKNGKKIIAIGRNKSAHPTFCPRKALLSPTGQGYDLCPGFCHSDNHSESAAIAAAKASGKSPVGTDLYLGGHWWACKPCWDAMIAAGIRNVFVAEGAKARYEDAARKDDPKAGRLKAPFHVLLLGNDLAKAAAALGRVGIVATEDRTQQLATILLPGAIDDHASRNGAPVYDYRSLPDYRAAIVKLSQDLK